MVRRNVCPRCPPLSQDNLTFSDFCERLPISLAKVERIIEIP